MAGRKDGQNGPRYYKDRLEMKVLFLNPATNSQYSYPHLGMAFLSAIVKQAGHDVICIDGSAPYRPRSNEDLVAESVTLKPDVICVTATTERVKFAYNLLFMLKNNMPDLPVIVGGPHATIRAVEMVAHGFDVAVVGPAEKRIVGLTEALGNKDLESLKKIPGIALNTGAAGIIFSPLAGFEDDFDLDSLLPVDFSCFEEKDYLRSHKDRYRYGALFVGRGCPGRCIYCDRSVFQRKLKIASPDKIVADMISRRNKYHVNEYFFLDDTLLWAKRALSELCMRMISCSELSGITWGCNARPNLVERDLLSLMKQAGCSQIILGVETGDQTTLTLIKKGISLEAMLACIDAILSAGIKVKVNLMNGFPWDNLNTLKAQIDLVEVLKGKGVSSISAGSTVFPYPGTEIFEMFSGKGYNLYNWWLRDDIFQKNNAASLKRKRDRKSVV
jgi:anaerobic magnesium-protoporphyrin IX monomethyl ester cyclase